MTNANEHKYHQKGENLTDWVLRMPGYDPEKEYEFTSALQNGTKLINISATCIVLNSIMRIMKQVNQTLNEMIIAGKDLSYSLVRKFVVNFYNLELADFILYSAMKAPLDDLFL